MKIYSEKTNKEYASVDECLAAEKEFDEAVAAKKAAEEKALVERKAKQEALAAERQEEEPRAADLEHVVFLEPGIFKNYLIVYIIKLS